jgi:hypothetical protein
VCGCLGKAFVRLLCQPCPNASCCYSVHVSFPCSLSPRFSMCGHSHMILPFSALVHVLFHTRHCLSALIHVLFWGTYICQQEILCPLNVF